MYVCVYINVCISYICMYVCVYINVCISEGICIYMRGYLSLPRVSRVHTHSYRYTHTYIHIYLCTCIHTHMYIYIYAHVNICFLKSWVDELPLSWLKLPTPLVRTCRYGVWPPRCRASHGDCKIEDMIFMENIILNSAQLLCNNGSIE